MLTKALRRDVASEHAPTNGLSQAAPLPVLAITKSTGGLAVYHRSLLSGLSPSDFAIHTLCLSDNGAEFAQELRLMGHTAEAAEMKRYRLDPLGDLRVGMRVARIARQRGTRVILCHGSKPGFIGRAAGWFLGIPAVYCQASLPFLKRVQKGRAPVYRLMERAARLFGGDIVALTEGARRLSIEHGVARADRIAVIRTGIDVEQYRARGQRDVVRARLGLPEDAPVILWIGRFEEQKAPEVFLEAAEVVCGRRSNVQVVIVGEGRQQAEIMQTLASSRFGGQIRVLPWQPDPAGLMEAADILCLSSRWEGLPLVLLEGMAAGAVPVSTAVDGCVEVIEDGKSGRLVPPDRPDLLAEALLQTLSDPLTLKEMSAAATARVTEKFDKSRMIAEWAAKLMELAARGSAR